MNTRNWEIYVLIDPRTSQIRYVGVTFRGKTRYNEHVSKAIKGGKTYRDFWIRSLVSAGVKPVYSVIERGIGDGWQDRERAWIAEYRTTTELVNLTDGGDGLPGYVPSEELKKKWSAMRAGVKYPPGRFSAMKGRKHSPEAVAKIQKASLGRKMTDSARAKVSAARKGKPLSAEHIEKLAAAKRGKELSSEHKRKIAAATTNRKLVMCSETGRVFASITEAARILHVREQSVGLAIRKGSRCKGYHFRFA